jgi:23S rRNA (adenine2503-C2)-methyltransferase
MKKYLLGLESHEIQEWFKTHNEKTFRAGQLIEWLYEKSEVDFAKMTNFSQQLRDVLVSEFEVSAVKLVKIQGSNDSETQKFLWELSDGKLVESVLIMSYDRRTVCVSSQVGCPANCAFCASGKDGFFRNLEAGEIVSQVYEINKYLEEKGERVSHVVYMGMGEPFRNYDEVVKSIRILNHEDMLNLSQRRITVSTVGVVENIKKFSDESFKVNLALSLHAPNQNLRKKIIPYARSYELADILAAMDEYGQKTKRDITYEYTLLAGINDNEEQAHELVKLLRGKQCTVNLIPYNPVEGLKLKKPEASAVLRFREILTNARIVNTCRYTKGDDIAAACGQLALQEKKPSQSSLVVL